MAHHQAAMMQHLHSSNNHGYAASELDHRERHHRTTPKPLNFNQAMSDFHIMFPELDRDVIETVLRANNGVVQSTIDQLLILQESTMEEKAIPGLPSYESSINDIGVCGDEPPPAYSDIWEEVGTPAPDPMFPGSLNSASSNASDTFVNNSRFWNASLVGKLPDDFLRLESKCNINNNNNVNIECSTSITSATSTEEFMTEQQVERFLEDEKLAMFLQNEEFLRELRRNPEFVTSLEADHRNAIMASGGKLLTDGTVTTSTATVESVASGGARPRNSTPVAIAAASNHDDAVFKQKLKHMGKSTRKKFGKMAKKFSRNKATNKSSIIRPSDSTFNLLGEEGDEDDRFEGLDNIQEDATEYEGDIETDEDLQRSQAIGGRRRLPQTPATTQSSGTDEPIVFYSEDNEFAYKNDFN